jgi:hypothetical protein
MCEPQGGSFFLAATYFPAINNGTNLLIYFQPAPKGTLSGIENLLCLAGKPAGLWGRSNGSNEWVAAKKKEPPCGWPQIWSIAQFALEMAV